MSGTVVTSVVDASILPRARGRAKLQLVLFLWGMMAIAFAFALAHAFWSGTMLSIATGAMITAVIVCYTLA